MTTHLSDSEIEAYRSRTASPKQLLAVNGHIFECDQCYRLLESPDKLRMAYDAISHDFKAALLYRHEHLDYGQLAGYVDGTLEAKVRESVSTHIEQCEECASEVREVAALKTRIETEADSQPVPPNRDRRATFWATWGYRLAPGLAVLLVVFAFMFWAYSRRMHLRVVELKSVTARLEQENNDLRRQVEGTKARQTGSTSLSLKDGNRQITISENGELVGLDTLPATYRDALKDALISGRVSIPPRPQTAIGQAGSRLGINPETEIFAVIFPAGTVVEDTRPVFEWQRLAGATSYTVFVQDLTTRAEIEGQPTPKTTWRPDKQFVRGHQYAWMVEANIDGQGVRSPASNKPFATFKVLDEQEAQGIGLARKTWESSHIVMGVIYAKAGLLDEAEKEFRELVAANPESFTARSLLASIEVQRISARREIK